ncbi:MAG: Ldh family oxidoreductase [Treponema sp.]|jgi:LDH2 family malate/lactate/ureidoglycolate dehydrogenase|nr:Ldh family oxidoreductase [Treponema sp.]
MDDYRYLDYSKTVRLCEEVFQKNGYSAEDAAIITDVLLESDLMGIESHGIQRLELYCSGIDMGRIFPVAKPEVVQETPVSAVVDAHESIGHLAGVFSMNLAIKKAKSTGIAVVTVRNSTHYGIAGYYAMMAAKENLLGLSMTNTEALVLPTFGKKAMMGTNPIAVAMPAKPYPFYLDMATSVVPAGKLEIYFKEGKPVPEGYVLDAEGKTTINAGDFINIRKNKTDGGLLPLGGSGKLFGGHKGYGLSLLVELLTGILSGGITSNHVRIKFPAERCCHFFMVVDYGLFGDKEAIESHMSDYMEELRKSAKAYGQKRIYTHGEPGLEKRQSIIERGIAVNKKTYQELCAVCDKFGLDQKEYIKERSQ